MLIGGGLVRTYLLALLGRSICDSAWTLPTREEIIEPYVRTFVRDWPKAVGCAQWFNFYPNRPRTRLRTPSLIDALRIVRLAA